GGGLELKSAMQHNPIEIVRQGAVGASIGVPIFTLYIWVLWLASIAGSRYVIRMCLGDAPSTGGSVRYAFARVGPATAALVLVILLTLGVALLTAFVGFFLSGLGAAMLPTLLPSNFRLCAGVLLVLFGLGLGFFVFSARAALVRSSISAHRSGAGGRGSRRVRQPQALRPAGVGGNRVRVHGSGEGEGDGSGHGGDGRGHRGRVARVASPDLRPFRLFEAPG